MPLIVAAGLVLHEAAVRTALDGSGAPAWAEDPRLTIKSAMNDIAKASVDGRPSAELVSRAVRVERRAPLSPEPFLVAAIAADEAGQAVLAQKLFLAARTRDPRLPAVRFLLGDHYRKVGKDGEALQELIVLARLQPQQQISLLPYFAKIASNPKHSAAVRRVIISDPVFGRQLLAAAVGENAPPNLILSLARSLPDGSANRLWQDRLLSRLVDHGEFAAARRILSDLARYNGSAPMLANADFSDDWPPLPFNWVYASTSDGVAEANGDGRLTLIYFGRNPLVMAGQVLILPPGRFRLRWSASGAAVDGDSFRWRVTCLTSGEVLAEAGLPSKAMEISVGSTCEAQRLELLAQPDGASLRRTASLYALRLERLP